MWVIMKNKLVLVLCFTLVSSYIQADECDDLSTVEMADCLNKIGLNLKTQLTVAYNRALKNAEKESASLPGTPDLKRVLIKSQKEWWKHRESQCDAETIPYATGSGYTNVYLLCMNRITAARIEELNSTWAQ